LIKKLIGYPIIIAICWVISTFYDNYAVAYPNNAISSSQEFQIFASVLPTIQGLMTALLFLSQYAKKKISAVIAPQNAVAAAAPVPQNVPKANVPNAPVQKEIQLAVSNKIDVVSNKVVFKKEEVEARINVVTGTKVDVENVVEVGSTVTKSKLKEVSQAGLRADGSDPGAMEDGSMGGEFGPQPDPFALNQTDDFLALDDRKHFNSFENAVSNRGYCPDDPTGIHFKTSQYLDIEELNSGYHYTLP
jgi:hypothetical protein